VKVADVAEAEEQQRKFGVEVLAKPTFSEAAGVPEGSPVKKRTGAAVKAQDGVVIELYTWG
jgi:hypothetical protein